MRTKIINLSLTFPTWLAAIQGNRLWMTNVPWAGASQTGQRTIARRRPYGPRDIVNEHPTTTEIVTRTETETKSDNPMIEEAIDPLNKRLTAMERDLAHLIVKVDEGFRRHDNWIKFLLGTFLTTGSG
ncbi:hypothetical protein C7212DRAFT_363617 [Tuber magnatum]|uniref:Uncharacterized protein n=1 Tax=Tuber magnatum TaxID=42249 RepID=A0A317SRQ9_9PEZI|nr:hypothetical protein C7212DRAFT_363617 [Tuber magnatum]